jgi:hypothetical protein
MNDVAIDKEAFLALWKLDELPACEEGMISPAAFS